MFNRKYNKVLYYLPILFIFFLFIYLGCYGTASSDDYADYMLVQKTGFLNAFEETYMHWGGRFTSYFLVFLLNPLNFGEQFGPALLNTFQIILFLFIPYLFTRILFKERKITREMIIAFSLIAGFILCYLPSPVELLYWFTGSWVYLPGLVFMLYWYVLIEKESKSKVDNLVIIALPFFIAGTNEINILLMAWLLFYSCLKSNNKRIIYFSLITFAIGAALALLTPGNMQRSNFFLLEAHHPARDFLFSIKSSFQLTLFYLKDWFRSTPILFVWLAMAILNPSVKFGMSNKIKVFAAFSIFMIPLLFFPFIYATGMINLPVRLLNVIFIFLFISGYFLFNQIFNYSHKRITSQTYLAAFIGVVLFFQSSYSSNLRKALFDLQELSEYQNELKWREQRVSKHVANSSPDTLKLPAIKHIPETVFYSDLSSNPGHWYNQGFAYYHGIKAVVIDEENPIK